MPHSAPTHTAPPSERCRQTIVVTAMTWSGSVAWRTPRKNPRRRTDRTVVTPVLYRTSAGGALRRAPPHSRRVQAGPRRPVPWRDRRRARARAPPPGSTTPWAGGVREGPGPGSDGRCQREAGTRRLAALQAAQHVADQGLQLLHRERLGKPGRVDARQEL